MSTSCGIFLQYLLKFKPLDDFFPLPKRVANLRVSVTRVCVWVHMLNKDFFQAVIGTFYQSDRCHFQKMGGWVAFKFLFFKLKFKSFKT